MRKHAIAGVAVAAALLVPGAALAAQPAVPAAGSMWDVGAGAGPRCSTVTTPPEAPAGEVPVLTSRPGQPDQWCWAYARLAPSGSLSLPGGVPGERLSPSAYAAQTGQAVTVVYSTAGVVVYQSS